MIHHLINLMVYIATIGDLIVVVGRQQSDVDECKIKLFNSHQPPLSRNHAITKLLELVAFKRTFLLNLSVDHDFLSKKFISEQQTGLWNSQTLTKPHIHNLDCFYTGFVNNQPERTASVSLCNGMLGTFYLDQTNYFIEPIFDNSTKLLVSHQMTRLSDRGNQTNPCGTTTKPCNDQPSNNEKKFFSKRVRRDMSRPFYLEVMVVTDYSMYNFHGEDTKIYVLTLMAAVANLYRQASIGVAIEVSLVRHYMIQDPDSPPEITNNALESLHNFCEWQSSLNTLDVNNPLHYDAAVLLTRKDLCRERCNTLGVAELNGLCSPSTSCAVIEDNGLVAGFTIAHELAHLFGVRHDGDKACIERGLTQSNIMSTSLVFGGNYWQWSDCSRHFFNAKLKSADLWCLRNKPTDNPQVVNDDQENMMQYPPGFYYPINDQCEKAFGTVYQYSSDHAIPFCKYLFCCRYDLNATVCATNHATVSDGTICTDSTIQNSVCSTTRCLHGECVCWYDRAPIEGKWGAWGPYGQCSRACGGGIQKRHRECNNPSPANGGRFCVGSSVGIRTCNLEKCPARYIEYRQLQCSKYNGQTFGHADLPINVRWVPKYEVMEKERCKLICQVQDDRLERSVVIADAVEDGTKCGPEDETTDICISGQCIRVGCDNVYDSESKHEIKIADMCGVCGGNNDTCEKISKQIVKDDYGFQLVESIPVGATNIEIKQVSARRGQKDRNYLVLKDSNGKESIINSEQSFSTRRRVVKYKSTPFEYTGTDTHTERINATNRLKSPVSLYVMKADVARMIIDVQYWLDNRSRRIFRWVQDVKTSYTPTCSRICNGIRQAQQYVCRDEIQTVLDDRCDPSTKPSVFEEPCNTDCYVSWVQIGYSPCSSRCGNGFKDVNFACRLDNRINGSYRFIENSHCVESVGPEPSMNVHCSGDCTESGWMFSAWSSCRRFSDQCFRFRNASCVDERGIEADDESLCIERYKLTKESCDRCDDQAEKGFWSVGKWTKCDCARGIQRRILKCQSSRGELLTADRCSTTRPPSYRRCAEDSCGKWSTGQWSVCEKSCGISWRRRVVQCVVGGRRNGKTVVDDFECSTKPKPIDLEPCVRPVCRSWMTGPWSKCLCPNQTRTREVWCRRDNGQRMDDYKCDFEQKPPNREACKCEKARWIAQRWTECSTPCDTGVRRRKVICVIGRRKVPVRMCRYVARPKDVEICSNRACSLNWRVGNWGECSTKCGNGTRTRLIECVREQSTVRDEMCGNIARPNEQQTCSGNDCAAWRVGRWSTCSVKCGKGLQARSVQCPLGFECNMKIRPVGARRCFANECKYQWNTSSWSQCAGECGQKGHRQRTVVCIELTANATVNPLKCRSVRPLTVEECELPDCDQWFTGGWSKCSVNCGRGQKRRYVYCLSANGQLSTRCRVDLKPQDAEPCTGRICRVPIWRTGNYPSCNGTCGKRKVWCSSGKCDRSKKPLEYRPCPSACGSFPKWVYGKWQQCREVNNRCLRRRDANCVQESGDAFSSSKCNVRNRKVTDHCKCGRWKAIGNLTCLCQNYTRSQFNCVLPISNKITAPNNCKQIRSLRSTLPQCSANLCQQ